MTFGYFSKKDKIILDVVGLTIVFVSKTTGLFENLNKSNFSITLISKSFQEISFLKWIGPCILALSYIDNIEA